MNRKQRFYKLLMASCLSITVACTAEEIGGAGEGDVPITLHYGTKSTTGTEGTLQFTSGETIWLWAGGSANFNAWQLTTDGNGSFTYGTKHTWPRDWSSFPVYALHGNFNPAIEADNTPWSGSFTHEIKDSQNTEVNYRMSDLLYCSATIGQRIPSNVLTFEHQLAKVELEFKQSDGGSITDEQLAAATVKIHDVKPKAIFDVSTQAITADGTPCDVTMGKTTTADAKVWEAVVPGQDLSPLKISMTYTSAESTERTLKCETISPVSLAKGKRYRYTLDISNGEIRISSVTVSDFTPDVRTVTVSEIGRGTIGVYGFSDKGGEQTMSWDAHILP